MDIFKENNITSIKQALTCKELWSLNNGISLCYICHKNLEKLNKNEKHVCYLIYDVGKKLNNEDSRTTLHAGTESHSIIAPYKKEKA